MGSNSPSSFPRSFTYLMNQTDTPQTPPFCTQSPSFSTQTPLFGTQTPLFSTQTPLFGDQTPLFSTQTSSTADDADGVDESSPLPTREARRRWTNAEDGALVTAWLNTSKDGVIANEEKARVLETGLQLLSWVYCGEGLPSSHVEYLQAEMDENKQRSAVVLRML
ncbi:unnamed protein product [Microthlaspi erraticum]|uniref:Uncharacterized protein n=1 Tax=Microthlaspi erraticum TaxID=1685480 RepID=A0A6D2JMQ7_9BRAS|nr:unnamed protein product [Microthlaspi erraticum]